MKDNNAESFDSLLIMQQYTHHALINVLQGLRKNNWTLACAESCTGGLLSATITHQSGVSDIYVGSVISYSNDVKMKMLGVKLETLQKNGAVSEEVALEMARGVRDNLKSAVGVAVTGVAGPTGGTPLKPVGLVCFAVCGPSFEKSFRFHFSGDRNSIQTASVHKALELIAGFLK